jgi:long-chain acyl-CoA synthetase
MPGIQPAGVDHSVSTDGSIGIGAEAAGTLPHLFRLRVAQSPDASAYRQFEAGAWRDYRWRDMAELVARWRAALAAEGLVPGDRVAMSLPNGVDWVCFDQAALALGLVTVPLYTTDSPGNLAYILVDSGARLLLLDNTEQWDGVRTYVTELPEVRRVLCRQVSGAGADPRVRALSDWLPAPTAAADTPSTADEPDALATLIYTSGTTGTPKGVMLSHRNILSNAEAVIRRIPPRPTDVFLSFLPLAHAFERTVGYILPMMAGCAVAYARSVEQLREDLLQVRPTVLLSVPRVYDKIYLAIQEKLGATGMKRRLFEATVRIGWQRLEAAQGRRPPPGPADRLRWAVLNPLVARKVLGRLGGRLRVAVSGGAPLSPTVGRFFAGLGLPLTEGYGLTEAAPTVTGIPPAGFRPGWVGPPLPEVEVRLGSQNEILVHGPGVCAGYWRQPQATARAIDSDGWLHTGDIGEIGADGQIGIRGRLKDIIVTSTGEKIPPTNLESALTMEPLFDQAMVIGEGRQFLAAILVLGERPWQELAADLGLDPEDPAALSDSRTRAAAQARADARLIGFPGYAQVRSVHLTREAWTVDNGLITPTMKLKRPELMDHFAAAIDAIYGSPPPGVIRQAG